MKEIKEKLTRGQERGQERDIENRNCLVCGICLEKPDFTCGHPQCNTELVEDFRELKEILEEYELENTRELEGYIEKLQEKITEVGELIGKISKMIQKI